MFPSRLPVARPEARYREGDPVLLRIHLVDSRWLVLRAGAASRTAHRGASTHMMITQQPPRPVDFHAAGKQCAGGGHAAARHAACVSPADTLDRVTTTMKDTYVHEEAPDPRVPSARARSSKKLSNTLSARVQPQREMSPVEWKLLRHASGGHTPRVCALISPAARTLTRTRRRVSWEETNTEKEEPKSTSSSETGSNS